mmetsp:Transcript_46612/g.129651  ORF Transcript_46612/g.129651 Transcript_46612/m.129651 type:complete len:216 (+) Transcript_46612:697-1344(+)
MQIGLEVLEAGRLAEPLIPIRLLNDSVRHGPVHRFPARVAMASGVASVLRIHVLCLLLLWLLLHSAMLLATFNLVLKTSRCARLQMSTLRTATFKDIAHVLVLARSVLRGVVARQGAPSAIDLVDDRLEGLKVRLISETLIPLWVGVDAIGDGPMHVLVARLARHRRVAALRLQHGQQLAARAGARAGAPGPHHGHCRAAGATPNARPTSRRHAA